MKTSRDNTSSFKPKKRTLHDLDEEDVMLINPQGIAVERQEREKDESPPDDESR